MRSYYVESCAYILAKFPLEEEWLKHAEVVDVSRRRSTSFASVMFFIQKLSIKCDVDQVEHPFHRYQIDRLDLKSERIDEK